MDGFFGRNYLVVGATSGIGSTLAKRLLREQAMVWLVSRDNNKMASEFSGFSNAHFIQCDLLSSGEIEKMFSYLKDEGIKLDGLAFCPGISPLMRIEETDIKILKDTYKVNVISFIEIMKLFCSESISREGASVVAMSSVAAGIASYRQTVYASTKAALEEAVRCIAKETLNRKIRVNALSAGAVDTPMLRELMKKSSSLKEKLEKIYPLGIITTEQVANQLVFLLSDNGQKITGSVINMDSGFLINK